MFLNLADFHILFIKEKEPIIFMLLQIGHKIIFDDGVDFFQVAFFAVLWIKLKEANWAHIEVAVHASMNWEGILTDMVKRRAKRTNIGNR